MPLCLKECLQLNKMKVIKKKRKLSFLRTFQSPWSWACVSGRCERRAVRSSRISLSTCQALCGGSTRLLWPRPTKRVELGTDSQPFYLQRVNFVTVNTSNVEVKAMLENAKEVFLGKCML